MIRVGLIGVGKMGMSHYAILGAHPDVQVRAVCDRASYLTAAIRKRTGIKTFKDYREMIDTADLDCVFVATPSSTHFGAASYALEKGLHAFVEKPLCLDPAESKKLAELATRRVRANQVGYHNRFIGTFREARRLVRAGALGDVYHIGGSAFGQVVIRPKTGNTWRANKAAGGGCLHDYASHVIDLMGFIVGPAERVVAAEVRSIFSAEVEDAVYAMLRYPNGASGQLEANWSDETHRKMSTTITVFGTKGKLIVDRQECRIYLRSGAEFEKYAAGWTIRYITDLQEPVNYYLRGEEYSAQIDAFVSAIQRGGSDQENSFASAYETDRTVHLIMKAAQGGELNVERILFGDNQFFGVNHMSEEKARAQAMQFKDTASMMRVLDSAYDMGIKVFMCTTHDRVADVAEIVRANPGRYRDFTFYPCMPYAHKYANSVGEVGMLETVRRYAVGGVVDTVVQGAMLALTQDMSRLMKLLVDAEMRRFVGVRTPIIFIQNVVTDLLLGLGAYDMFAAFAEHVKKKYGAEPGFITMNLPLLVDALERVGVKRPIVCANINKIGFRMCGGVDAYREILRSGRCRAIAMSVLASGAIPPREAFEWVCGLEGLESIVFGASSVGNIRQSKDLIDKAWGLKPANQARPAAAP